MVSNLHQSILVKAINEYIEQGYSLVALGQTIMKGYRPDAIVENNDEIVIIESVVSSYKGMNLTKLQPLFSKPIRIDKRRNPYKFMLTLHDDIYAKLKDMADKRKIKVQELVRAVIIPDWLETHKLE